MPLIDRLALATVSSVPEWHPEHDTFAPFPVHAWVIRHPDGLILVDTGVGLDNRLIDDWYDPHSTVLSEALGNAGLSTSDVAAVVLSHLHFDHCGQQSALSAPTHVQADEWEVAQEAGYTVPEWGAVSEERLRLVHGEEEIAEGVRLMPTPGHTPGHQSVVIEAGEDRVVIAAQCAFRADELRSGQPSPSNLYEESWLDVARDSLHRVRSLAPCTVHLSHDQEMITLQ
jgi:N-acyl homoserine lactone hydrolase